MSEISGWKDWNGDGACPVPPDTEIQFQVKGESKEEASWWPYVRAGDCRWDHRGLIYSDLIAYRIHPNAALSQDTPSLPLKPQEAVSAGIGAPPPSDAGTLSEAE